MRGASDLASLPLELARAVVLRLDATSLIHLAACCQSLRELTDDVAQAHCDSEHKGLWCGGHSWRVQLYGERNGRRFRSSLKVLRQHGSAGTRRRCHDALDPARSFSKPVAVAALSRGRAVVCNAGAHNLVLVQVACGTILEIIAIDGVPSGVSRVPSKHRDDSTVVITVQGTEESGNSIDGVANNSHRVECYSFNGPHAERLWVQMSMQPIHELSYPNGLTATRASRLFITDWNNHRVVESRVESSQRIAGVLEDDPGTWRPCDVVLLPDPAAGPAIAVADYYSKAVRLYVDAVPHAGHVAEYEDAQCKIGIKVCPRLCRISL